MGGHIFEMSSDRIKRETREEDRAIYEPIIEEQKRSIEELNAEVIDLKKQLAELQAQAQ